MQKKSFILIFLIVMVAFFMLWHYMDYIKHEKKDLEYRIYKEEALFMQKNLASMIDEKKKSTTAIALTLASNEMLPILIKNKKELHKKINSLIFNFEHYTNYKNIWVHIIDKDANSIYRSWTTLKGDTFCQTREDLQYAIKKRETVSLISVDIFSINIKAIVPFYNKKNELIGLVEVVSHFNSISKKLKKLGVDSVVVVNEEYSKYIKYPFTNMYIQKCYIANFDAPQSLQEYLKNNNIKQYCKDMTRVENGYIVSAYPLKDYDGHKLGFYIMFKKTETISTEGLDFFVFRWSVFAILLLMALAGVVNITLYYMMRKQKSYYKNIIDTSSNIMLVNDKKKIIDANKTFFEYFKKYKTVDEFRKENTCICNYYVEEEGYLDKGSVAYGWLDFVLANKDKINKVKMEIDGEIYYFLVNASLISQEKEHYSVIFSDITKEEEYKKELEILNVKDTLTNVYNRRYYEQAIEKEMYNAKRYGYNLAVIMLDIDFFKKINDEHGHSVGDEVLVFYAKLIEHSLRESDSLCRIGGEEFIIILPHTNRDDAYKIAEKLRIFIQKSKKIVPITISFGVTEYISGESKDYLYKRVDEALYEAKESGRNRVVAK
ncbi:MULTISPECIES: diguanylate cyclase [Sulfurimonas]|uniref:GGDEF domain-containing protein n=1 Tax=Sulfurimonas TaxID=202746 RepID=UPI001263F028|nr:diguanylate cyclase [Sulfurimonas indica]